MTRQNNKLNLTTLISLQTTIPNSSDKSINYLLPHCYHQQSYYCLFIRSFVHLFVKEFASNKAQTHPSLGICGINLMTCDVDFHNKKNESKVTNPLLTNELHHNILEDHSTKTVSHMNIMQIITIMVVWLVR